MHITVVFRLASLLSSNTTCGFFQIRGSRQSKAAPTKVRVGGGAKRAYVIGGVGVESRGGLIKKLQRKSKEGDMRQEEQQSREDEVDCYANEVTARARGEGQHGWRVRPRSWALI